MPESKLISLREAVERYVPDNASIAMGLALEPLIPFAAGHEMIRQEKRGLTLIGPISDILFDQLIGAGCVKRVIAAWVGNVITGSGHRFREAVESGAVAVEDHSNLTISMALSAGAMGVPFMPSRTGGGSSLFQGHAGLARITCPFSGQTLTAVRAILPDITILHAQRSDVFGNAHVWGSLGMMREGALAAGKVIIITEEIIPTGMIRSDPNRVIVPGFKVCAVVHSPWGAHPSPVPGWYNRDHEFFRGYADAARTREGFMQWKKTWIDGAGSPAAYLARLGEDRAESLRITRHLYSEACDNGY